MSVRGSKLRWWIDPMGVCPDLRSVALNRLLGVSASSRVTVDTQAQLPRCYCYTEPPGLEEAYYCESP
jgi:hypothetical protein